MPFNQRENLRNALIKYKAKIAHIERTLNQPRSTMWNGQPVKVIESGLLRLEEERQHLLYKVAELEAELGTQTRDIVPAASSIEHWTNELVPLCESASRFIVGRYKSDPALTPLELWDEYLLECYPTSPYAHLGQEERENARLEDIKKLVTWAETVRTPQGQVASPPCLQEQVSRFGVSQLVPKQVFLTLAASDLRPVEGIRTLIHSPLSVAQQYASAICGETYQQASVANSVQPKTFISSRKISKAPPPPTELSGLGWVSHGPKPTQPLLNWPMYYPQQLIPQTTVIILEAIKRFPVQTQTPELCRCVISGLTPHFCAAVQSEVLRADLALSTMSDLLHDLVVTNCHDSERFRIEQETKKSDEWLRFARKLRKLAAPSSGAGKKDRRAQIDSFLTKLADSGRKAKRKDIWIVAGYKGRTEFERFQSESRRATAAAIAAFSRVLAMTPENFFASLDKHRPPK